MENKYGDHLVLQYGCSIVEGGRQGPDVPADFDPASLKLISFLRSGETNIVGTEMQRRAVEELDALYGRKLLYWFLCHQDQIPEEWRGQYVVFAGDHDFRDMYGREAVLCLYFNRPPGTLGSWHFEWNALCNVWSGKVLAPYYP